MNQNFVFEIDTLLTLLWVNGCLGCGRQTYLVWEFLRNQQICTVRSCFGYLHSVLPKESVFFARILAKNFLESSWTKLLIKVIPVVSPEKLLKVLRHLISHWHQGPAGLSECESVWGFFLKRSPPPTHCQIFCNLMEPSSSTYLQTLVAFLWHGVSSFKKKVCYIRQGPQ